MTAKKPELLADSRGAGNAEETPVSHILLQVGADVLFLALGVILTVRGPHHLAPSLG